MLLKYDPIPKLLVSGNSAIQFFYERDLLGIDPPDGLLLRQMDEPLRILHRQRESGGWQYLGVRARTASNEDYNQIETFRNIGILVEKYAFDRSSPALEAAAEFLFQRQTDEGDFRGIYGTQYSPNYSAAIMELLIKAGYSIDPRINIGFEWLLSIRQDDGGWAIPIRTRMKRFEPGLFSAETFQPDRTKPYSQLATGMVLRAFAAHPTYSSSQESRAAGELLAKRILQPDQYPDRKGVSYWTSFSFPFWFTDLLSALDSLTLIGIGAEHPGVKRGLDWLIDSQMTDGGWQLKMLRDKDPALAYWLQLAICRIFQRLEKSVG